MFILTLSALSVLKNILPSSVLYIPPSVSPGDLNAYPIDTTLPVKLPAPYTSNFTLGFVVPIPRLPEI